MALTEKNQLLIAFKKLYGKSHTSAKFGIFNESIGSSVQLGSSTIFGNNIPSVPSSSLYSITEGTVEKIQFTLEPIALSTYASTLGSIAGTTIDDEGNTAVNGVHAYKLVLPSDYVSNSSNAKKGTGAFLNSAVLSDSNGALQLVPPSFGDLYSAQISSSSGIIGGLDDEDYYLDYYSGILFIQDIGRTPTAVTAYAYVGDFVSDLLTDITSDYITEVVAGTNLTGGGSSGSVTVSLADNISLTSVTASLYGTASHAITASYAESTTFDPTQIIHAYKRLRYQEIGYFDASGSALIQLPTGAYGGSSFPTASLDYVNVSVFVKDGTLWTNDILAVSVYESSSYIYVSLEAPELTDTDQYKLLAVNEDPTYYTI